MKSNWAKRWGIILILLGFAIGIPGVWLLIAHDRYQATTRIKPFREFPDPAPPGDGNAIYDPYFIQTEYEVIKSEAVLGRTVEALHLDMEWGKRYTNGRNLEKRDAIELLRQCLSLHPIRGTNLIEISVIGEDAKEAANIANAIAESYLDNRLEAKNRLVTSGIDALKEEQQALEQQIKEKQTEIDRLKTELNPPDVAPEQPDPKSQPYWEAKEKLKRLNHFREILSKKNLEISDQNRSPSPMASVVDVAKPPITPIGPNRMLGKILLGAGVLLILSGARLLWRAIFAAPVEVAA